MNQHVYRALTLLTLPLFLSACNSKGTSSEEPGTQSCEESSDCSEPTPICSSSSRVCVACIQDSDCGADAVCTLNACEAIERCMSSKDCPTGLVCDESAQRCVECLSAADCADTETCALGSCETSCASDKDCAGEDQLCSTAAGYCVDCLEDNDCEAAAHCQELECVPDVCSPGYTECSGDDLLTCNESGAGFESVACAEGCTGAAGEAECSGTLTTTATAGSTETSSGGSGGASGGTTSSSTDAGGNGGSTTSVSSGGTTSPTTSTETTTTGGSNACGVGAGCGQVGDTCVRRIPVTYRDFNAIHDDFEPLTTGTIVTGLVLPTLGSNGKPVLASAGDALAAITSAESFAEWYTDGAGRATIESELVLFDDGFGGFVNRWGANGEQWTYYDSASMTFCASTCDTCLVAPGQACYPSCPVPFYELYACGATPTPLDGTPLFFPIDSAPGILDDTRYQARVPEEYGYPGWPWELDVLGTGPLHNFHFTTEIHMNFVYDASASQAFEFLGDDDLWVFLDGQLVVDLGGRHVPLAGGFALNATTAATYGLVDGQSYEISVFHAERQTEGSSFLLRLTGFEGCGS